MSTNFVNRLSLISYILAQRLSSGGGGVESEFNQAAYRRRQQRLVGWVFVQDLGSSGAVVEAQWSFAEPDALLS